ncbi:MAG: nicotinate phosphoribosyltransferase [Bacteroidia bacterium]|nr:nicotinate phosphoribosyltransferase [Bacteroidia bacterium]
MESLLCADLALYTDYYQLTMAQGYLATGQHRHRAVFDYYFRKLPFEGGYAVFAGLKDVVEQLPALRFTAAHLDYLRSTGIGEPLLTYLQGFRFTGSVWAVSEGEVVFPFQPLVRVEAPLIEAQLVETFLLNWLNFNTLVATKASRIRAAAGPDRMLLEMGLRRAQGFGGMAVSQAATVGGFTATSNVLAGYLYGLEVAGTHAHAWVQSFDDELTAFRAFAEQFPTRCTLLVDTYDTLRSGVPNAITVGKELEAQGHRLRAIRLDSGDLAYLSKRARALLDEAGLGYVQIAATNDLDEYTIQSLNHQGAPIDILGVGTKLATADGSPALGGVYKLAALADAPRMKVSDNLIKVSLPGRKQSVRYTDAAGQFVADGILLVSESAADTLYHPYEAETHTSVAGLSAEPLLRPVITDGTPVPDLPDARTANRYRQERLARLAPEHQRFENPHTYRVGISPGLKDLRARLLAEARAKAPTPGNRAR